jgi:Subtilisin-like serine proteases
VKKIFLVFTIFFSVLAVSGAELFYSDGTSIPMKKSEELSAVKTTARDADNQKGAVYRMNTGKYVYSFVSGSGKKGVDTLPVYFLGNEPVVAERTLLWRGEKPIEYMEEKYNMKLTEIFPTYPLYAFSVEGDSVEISEKIVKNGDGYAFADIVRETILHFVPESAPQDDYFGTQWHLHNTGTASFHYSNIDLDRPVAANADTKFLQMLEFLHNNNIEADTNTKIAIMDTGVAPDHEDLTNLDVGWNALENKEGGYPDSNVSDTVTHGTTCAGVSAGVGNDIGMSGVCPWCRIYPVKWQTGHGATSHSTSDMLPVYEKYVADPDITTINCSFGPSSQYGVSYLYPGEIEAIRSFMEHGRDGKGGVVVYASGNDGTDSSYNRLFEYDFKFKRNGVEVSNRVVTVNASTAWDTRAEYSNYGPASTVSAPSLSNGPVVGIATATIPGAGEFPADGSDYTRLFSGTSAAAPVVSGLFGVLFSINPDLTLEEVVDILKRSADKINPSTGLWDENGFSVKYGYGRVNLEKAVRLAKGFEMCGNVSTEVCGNHLDDDCDGYVDEGEECSSPLPAGKPCSTDADCVSGPWTASDVVCLTSREAWVFKGGYCFVKSSLYSSSLTYSFAPCSDGTKILGGRENNYDYYCALECNREHPCQREGYYCTDEVLGICVPLCSNDSDCTEGYSCSNSGHCTSMCGNGRIDDGEACDDGDDNGATYCAYGETSCTVCTSECQQAAGKTSYCGDRAIDPHYGEECDKGSYYNGNLNCAYGEMSCTVCTSDCKETAGTISYCGDGVRNTGYEACDNGTDNGRTDCVYGEYSCTVCTADCYTASGATSYCGDSRIDASNGEVCDNGSGNGRTNCAYGEHSCTVCTSDCHTDDGITSYCGDSRIDTSNGEGCDVGPDNGMITDCAYGETSCTVCTADCHTAAGATSYCGDSRIDASNGEVCDNGSDNGRTACAYGETSCTVCTTGCQPVEGTVSYCGDSRIDTSNGEGCDIGPDNGMITDCAYGETSCTVCTADCHTAAGTTSYCGDGTVDSANGEACDNAFDNGRTNCVYGEESCIVCTADCHTDAGTVSYCGDGNIDAENGEICDDGADNGMNGHCTSECKEEEEVPDEGDTTPDEGDTTPDEGDTAPDEGDTTPDEGDTAPDEGDTAPDEGDTAPDEGDTAPDEGDTAPDEGDTAPDEGDTAPDEGDTAPDEGDNVEADDSSEKPVSDDENAATEDKKKSGGCSVLVL